MLRAIRVRELGKDLQLWHCRQWLRAPCSQLCSAPECSQDGSTSLSGLFLAEYAACTQ